MRFEGAFVNIEHLALSLARDQTKGFKMQAEKEKMWESSCWLTGCWAVLEPHYGGYGAKICSVLKQTLNEGSERMVSENDDQSSDAVGWIYSC